MTILVLGSGGHARVIVSSLRAVGIEPDGLTDPDPTKLGLVVEGVRVIGTDAVVLTESTSNASLYNGVGNVARRDDSGLSARRKLFELHRQLGYQFPVLSAPGGWISSSARVMDGVQLMVGSIIQAGAVVFENTIINTAAIIEHDCRIGPHSHVAPGAIVCGGAVVGAQCHIGAGAVILQNRSIPDGAVVPAGTVVRS